MAVHGDLASVGNGLAVVASGLHGPDPRQLIQIKSPRHGKRLTWVNAIAGDAAEHGAVLDQEWAS